MMKEFENDFVYKSGLFLFAVGLVFGIISEFFAILAVIGSIICSYRTYIKSSDIIYKISGPFIFLGLSLFILSSNLTPFDTGISSNLFAVNLFIIVLGASLYAFRRVFLRATNLYHVLAMLPAMSLFNIINREFNLLIPIIVGYFLGLIINLPFRKNSKEA